MTQSPTVDIHNKMANFQVVSSIHAHVEAILFVDDIIELSRLDKKIFKVGFKYNVS